MGRPLHHKDLGVSSVQEEGVAYWEEETPAGGCSKPPSRVREMGRRERDERSA